MKDIQKATGLGLATISKYINGGSVRPATKALLDQAIEELGYRRNETARALKTSRTKTIGVLIPELNNLFSTAIVSSVEDSLRHLGYAVLVCDCRSDPMLERQAVEFLLSKRVDGILNMPVSADGSHLIPAERAGIPVVLIDRKVERKGFDAVIIDNRAAAQEAVARLAGAGHRRIGLICGGGDVYTFRERRAGYAAALACGGIAHHPELDRPTAHTMNGGYGEMKRLLALKPSISAVFVANYEMTLGAVIAANEAGVKMPGALSFIGFDNLELSRAMTPRLTTVAQPMDEIAAAATELMMDALGGEGSQRRTVMLEARLVEGASVGEPPYIT